MILDSQVKGAPQPYTYRQWIHDCMNLTDEDLNAMSWDELTALEKECENIGEGSSREWNGTH